MKKILVESLTSGLRGAIICHMEDMNTFDEPGCEEFYEDLSREEEAERELIRQEISDDCQ